MVAAVVSRTRLVVDAEAMAKIDTELASAIGGWGTLSADKLQSAIDYWVDRDDPAAVRRAEISARGRHVDVFNGPDGSGLASMEGALFAADAAALDQRLDDDGRDGVPRRSAHTRAAPRRRAGRSGPRW
jgi:Domain of unknown function (DUF222)